MLNNLVISGDVNGTRNSKSGTSTRFTMWSTWILVYTRSTRNKFSRKSMSYEKLLLTISFGRQNDRRKKSTFIVDKIALVFWCILGIVGYKLRRNMLMYKICAYIYNACGYDYKYRIEKIRFSCNIRERKLSKTQIRCKRTIFDSIVKGPFAG